MSASKAAFITGNQAGPGQASPDRRRLSLEKNLRVSPGREPKGQSLLFEDIEPAFDFDLMLVKFQPCPARLEKIFSELVAEARLLARPRAAFRICRIESGTKAEVFLGGQRFSSRLLRDNLAGLDLAFAYAATEGPELAEWGQTLSSSRRYLAWHIRYAALKLAEKKLVAVIKAKFAYQRVSAMNPGALKYWPISQQRPLFDLLSPLPENLGITLRPNNWMSPDLSSSGIFFPTELQFYNCQLCRVEPCERRRVAYLGADGWPKSNRRQSLSARGY